MTKRDERILANLIANKAETDAELDVLTFVSVTDDGEYQQEVRTYPMLWQEGQKIAHALVAQGMDKGDRFALLSQNHPEFVDAMVGSSIVGTVLVPVDSRTRGDKLVYMLSFVQCKGVICADYALSQLLEIIDQVEALQWIWVIKTKEGLLPGLPAERSGKQIRWLREILPTYESDLPVAVTDPDDIMQMLYTSGTTGDPKAIEASYLRWFTVGTLGSILRLEPGDRPYTGLSLTHANAQLITLGNILYMGLRGVISRKFTKSRLWDICRHYGCTMFNLLGGMTTALYSEAPKANDADNPVRYVLSAGMPAPIWNQFRERFGVEVFEFYGAAEGGLTFNPPGVGPVGSIGKAPPTQQVRVVDKDELDCPAGVQGEIIFRNADGTAPCVSYYKDPRASALKTRDGWLRMGDFGHVDSNGWLYFDCRMGSGIRRNGDFINTPFIEKIIAEDPDVDDVFIYGVPAANGVPGEKDVVAVVVPRTQAQFSPEKLFQRCRAALEANFIPTYIQVMREIPKTASEKPQERFCLADFNAYPERVFTEQ